MSALDDALAGIDSAVRQNANPADDAQQSSGPAAAVLANIAGAVNGPGATASNDQLLPIAPYNATDAAAHGLTLGLSDMGSAALTAGTRYLRGDTPGFDYPQAAREIQRGREAYAGREPFANAAANVAGGLATAGPVGAAAVGRAAGPVMQTIRGALTGAGMGAVEGAADNSASVGDAASGALTGAEFGGAAGGAVPVARAFVPGLTPSAQALRATGVEPTPGSAMGGIPGLAEDLWSRVPILGAPVQAGRRAAQEQLAAATARQGEDFQRAAINRPLSHIGESLNPATDLGNPAIQEMADKISGAYNAAVPAAGAALDPAASREIINAVNNAKLSLPPDQARLFENFVDTGIRGKMNGTTLPGEDFKKAESDLGLKIRNIYSGQSNSAERDLAENYRGLQATLRDWLERSNPATAAEIRGANQAWREMQPVQYAAGGNLNGNFTPMSLGSASRIAGGRTQFARGAAPMQSVAQDAAQQQQDLANLGATLRSPTGGGGHAGGTGISGAVLGADIMERILEHPHGPALAAAALGYPLLAGAYSNAGRGLLNTALSAGGGLLRKGALFSPVAGEYAASPQGQGLLPAFSQ